MGGQAGNRRNPGGGRHRRRRQDASSSPGESFSYHSYHAVCANAEVSGGFLLEDDEGQIYAVRVPDYHLEVPFWSV